MIHLLIKPPCFPTTAIYKQWRELAVHSKEIVSPCDDCTAEYMMNMRELQRCNQDVVLTDFRVMPRSIQQRLDFEARHRKSQTDLTNKETENT